jgi:Ca2+-binding RTX toxin-like protein
MALSILRISPSNDVTEGTNQFFQVVVQATENGDAGILRVGGGTAAVGVRFTPASINIGPLQAGSSQILLVSLIDNNISEPIQTIPVFIESAQNVTAGRLTQIVSPFSDVITLRDNDPVPPPVSPTGTLTFSPTNVYTVDEGAGFINISLRYTGGGAGGLQSFNVVSRNGTASVASGNGNDPRFGDYGFNNAEFEFEQEFGANPGEAGNIGLTTAQVFNFTIPIIDDRELEGNETFFLTLDSVVGALSTNNTVAITIIDNDEQSFSPFFVIPPTPRVGTPDADLLELTDNADLQFANQGNDTISGRGGNDSLYGGADQDLIDGGNGNDFLFGNRGNDTLIGGNGNDYLFGGQGDDELTGSSGNDTLSGDLGFDFLTGGFGTDVFVLRNSSQLDTITDFEPGTDLFALADGVKFQDISIQPGGQDTIVSLTRTGEILARVLNTSAGSLGAGNFIQLPNPFV